jgi:hypothetical protein
LHAGAGNYYIAIGVLAAAQGALLQGQSSHGLAATCVLQEPEFEATDMQKRLRTMVLTVKHTSTALDVASWQEQSMRLSTNRTKNLPEVATALQNSLQGPNQGLLVEARGEQAVTRGLKALLMSQSLLQEPLLLTAWLGDVIDVVAEKQGVSSVVKGTCILIRSAKGVELL